MLSLVSLLVRLCFFFLALFIQENSNDLVAQENIELMLMPSTSQENSKAAAILASTENFDDVDYDEDDFLPQENIKLMPMPLASTEKSSAAAILISSERIGEDDNEEDDFPDKEGMELLPMPSTSQGNNNASTILISIENTDEDDYDYDDNDHNDDDYDREEERKSNGFLVQAKAEVLQMPSTSQRNSNAPVTLKSSENNDDDDDDDEEEEETDSFTTQKLFSFAWQIAKGMVSICIATSK